MLYANWILSGHIEKIYVNSDKFSGDYGNGTLEAYKPEHKVEGKLEGFGHGGSDFYSMYYFIEKILGNTNANTIDIYEALDMFLPRIFAYPSILAGGIPMDIPNTLSHLVFLLLMEEYGRVYLNAEM